MNNADSFSTGGLNSAIGPILMRKVAPLSIQAQDVVSATEVYSDSIFGSVARRMQNLSFSSKISAAPTTLRGLLDRATAR